MSGGSGGAGIYIQYIYRLNKNADGLELVEGIYFDAREDADNPYFFATPTGEYDEYGYDITDFKPIKEVQADAILAKYEERQLTWKPLAASMFSEGDNGPENLPGFWETDMGSGAEIRMYEFRTDGTWRSEYFDFKGEGNAEGPSGTWESTGSSDGFTVISVADDKENTRVAHLYEHDRGGYGLIFMDDKVNYWRFEP